MRRNEMIAVIIRKYPIKLGIYRSIVCTVTSRVRPGEVETGFVDILEVTLDYVENAKSMPGGWFTDVCGCGGRNGNLSGDRLCC